MYLDAKRCKSVYEYRIEYIKFKIHEVQDKGNDEEKQYLLPRIKDEYDELKEHHDKMVYVLDNIGIKPIKQLHDLYNQYDSSKLTSKRYWLKSFNFGILYRKKGIYNGILPKGDAIFFGNIYGRKRAHYNNTKFFNNLINYNIYHDDNNNIIGNTPSKWKVIETSYLLWRQI